jgi:hypothetical protein
MISIAIILELDVVSYATTTFGVLGPVVVLACKKITFKDPLRCEGGTITDWATCPNPVNNPSKDREVSLMTITAYGSMGSDGLASNVGTFQLNTGTGNSVTGTGLDGYWRCNDCFQSSAASIKGTALNAYQYTTNDISFTLPANKAWCVSKVQIDMCARPGKPIITAIQGVNGANKDALSPIDKPQVKLIGKNLGPLVESVSYGPAAVDGTGYRLDNPAAQCEPPQSPYTELICTILPGIGGPHKWRIKTNKVTISDLSTVTTSYAAPLNPTVTPTPVSTLGGMKVAVGGPNTYVALLASQPSATAKLIVDGDTANPYTPEISGNTLLYTVPEMASQSAAQNGISLKIKLDVTDGKVGNIGQHISTGAAILKYAKPVATGVTIDVVGSYAVVDMTVEGSNFGKVAAVKDQIEVCRAVGGCATLASAGADIEITSWTHDKIVIQFKNSYLGSTQFPGTIQIRIGNEDTAKLSFTKDAPRIVNWNQNLNMLFRTTGEGINATYLIKGTNVTLNGGITVRVNELDLTTTHDDWVVTVGDGAEFNITKLPYCANPPNCPSGGSWIEQYKSTATTPPYTDIIILIPPGQGKRISMIIGKKDGSQISNKVYYGGYYPPTIELIKKDSTLITSQASGEYNSKDRTGIPSAGATVSLVGQNFGIRAVREWCDVPQVGCVGSPSSCCEGRWKSAPVTGTSHTASTASIPAGIGYDHLFRIVVSGQASNALAVRYSNPVITAVLNQSLPTSGTSNSDTSPGTILLQGQHFGMFGTDSSSRFGLPQISVGPFPCIVDPVSWRDTSVRCSLAAGQGKNLAVSMVVGTQQNTGGVQVYAYKRPVLAEITPIYGLTDGSTKVDVTGANFGTASGKVTLDFLYGNEVFSSVISSLSHTHFSITKASMPVGQGKQLRARVTVDGQSSDELPLVPGLQNPSNDGFDSRYGSINLPGPYLPPLLIELNPNHGPASGCDIFEDVNTWRKRFTSTGGGGRRCRDPATFVVSGLSLGKRDVTAEIYNPFKKTWEVFASDNSSLDVRRPIAHTHSSIKLPAPVGLGKDRIVRITVGGQLSVNTLTYNFDPPLSLEVFPLPFDARGTEPIDITAVDGLGEDQPISLNVTINGLVCKDVKWKSINIDDGRPYLTCLPQPDVAGNKNLSIFVGPDEFITPANTLLEFNKSSVFSTCKAGITDLSTGKTKKYYGRPCKRNDSSLPFFNSAPCVQAMSGQGELCAECPEGAICYVPGTPWLANRNAQYTYFDPTAQAGFFRVERDVKDVNDKAEVVLRVDEKRWDPAFLALFPSLYQREKVFDFVPCLPSDACTGSNECDIKYRFVQEKCKVWQEANPAAGNCTSDAQCQTRSGEERLPDGQCASNRPEDCAVCDMTRATSDGVGQCRCTAPKRCGRCTLYAQYSNGVEVKGHFMLDGECKECPQNIALIVVMFVLAIIAGGWGAFYLNRNKVNLAFASIGVDYFQVLAIFRGANIPWPKFLTSFFRFFAFFNLNIDIAAPECLNPNLGYSLKFIITEIMPLVMLAFIVLFYVVQKIGHKLCPGLLRRDTKPDWRSYISVYMITVNFLYLVVTRRAFQIFNCNPTSPADGWSYTTFSDPSCPLGLCRCYDSGLHEETKDFFHRKFITPAAMAVSFYTVGFPLVVALVILRNKGAIKEDQYLRILGLGDKDTESTNKAWSVRLKYYQLYYYFRPGKVYWLLWILYRKASIAVIATVFYSNPGFQLAFTILILFSSYVMQVRSRPYLSQTEKSREIAAHNERVEQGDEKKMQLENEIKRLRVTKAAREADAKNRKKRLSFSANYESLSPSANEKFFFDYNTVELLLLGCSIFICAAGIMFVSGQFDNRPDLAYQSVILQIAVLCVIVFSLVYYGMVVLFELFDTSNWKYFNKCMKFFASKLENLYDDDEDKLHRGESVDLRANPLHENFGNADEMADKDAEIARLRMENAKKDQTVSQLMTDLKSQKKSNMRAGDRNRKAKIKRKAKKQEFAQEMVRTGSNNKW